MPSTQKAVSHWSRMLTHTPARTSWFPGERQMAIITCVSARPNHKQNCDTTLVRTKFGTKGRSVAEWDYLGELQRLMSSSISTTSGGRLGSCSANTGGWPPCPTPQPPLADGNPARLTQGVPGYLFCAPGLALCNVLQERVYISS